MSYRRPCEFWEVNPDEWYYILAQDPGMGWLNDATAYGPFDSKDDTHQHLKDNHSNPGGCTIYHHDYDGDIDDQRETIIDKATDPSSTDTPSWRR